jgi:hypothetical protein
MTHVPAHHSAAGLPVSGLPVSGLIEGFYGPPWTWVDRERAVRFLAEHGANTYLYAPKNDPLHRDRWREPYLPEEWRRFAHLAGVCAEVEVDLPTPGEPVSPTMRAHRR